MGRNYFECDPPKNDYLSLKQPYEILVLNSNNSINKWKKVAGECKLAGIKCSRFTIIDDSSVVVNPKSDTKYEVICNQNEKEIISFNYALASNNTSPSKIGEYCSYMQVWKNMTNSEDAVKIVLKDNVSLNERFLKEKISIFINKLPSDFYLGYLKYNNDDYVLGHQRGKNLLSEIDNIQTRSLAGEQYFKGECTEDVFNIAKENILHKFSYVVPTEDVETLMSIIANEYGIKNIAYARSQITAVKIVSKEDTDLCERILECNKFDSRLYNFVKEH